MKDKDYTLKLNFKFWIETDLGQSILGEGKWLLLKAIRDTGSLKAAIEKMGYSYRQTWENLKLIEQKLGFKIIEKSRGGERGGQTVLTARAKNWLIFLIIFIKKWNLRLMLLSKRCSMNLTRYCIK